MKTNLTIQLDALTVRRIQRVAAARGVSVEAPIAEEVEGLVADAEQYEAARRLSLQLMEAASERGGRTWTRNELHER